MRKHLVVLLTVLAVAFGSCVIISQRPSNQWGQIINESTDAVVSITIHNISDPGTPVTAGSGFVISEDGYIITSYHVLATALQDLESWNIWARFEDDRLFAIKIVRLREEHDLALLKIDAQNLEFIELEDEYFAHPGDNVITIGNAYPFIFSVTSGIVSKIEMYGSAYIIQMTAPINSGCSGGPIINSRGKVVGVIAAWVPSHRGIYLGVDVRSVHLILKACPNNK